jgi:2,4-dienoyl-CoA reductase-like NADH-dependent reductase (Old Yellow Enzyme family)
MKKTSLFSSFQIKDLVFKNKLFMSPMCQYSAVEGVAQDWHFVHLGARAVGGAALVMTEAAAVSPEGRISPNDLGIWNLTQVESLKKITRFILDNDSVPAIQLAHAGRKAGTATLWQRSDHSYRKQLWQPIAPSPIPFAESYLTPKEMQENDLNKVKNDFVNSASLAFQAGFKVIEIHMAHGYLLHEFLSPISNQRTDQYGGPLKNRIKFPLEIAKAVRSEWPLSLPLFVRISASDWITDGWSVDDSVVFCNELAKIGVDLIDVSSGGTSLNAIIPQTPGYQVQFSDKIKAALNKNNFSTLVSAVGLITSAKQAEEILLENKADVIFLGRELLRDPYWPLHAAKELAAEVSWPNQYERAKT